MKPEAVVDFMLEGADDFNPQRYIDEIPERHTERWIFTREELNVPESCHGLDEFIALPADSQQGVIVNRNGTVTNRWEDGTAGVPELLRRSADEVDTLVSIDGIQGVSWRDVFTDENGSFVDWAE